MRTAVAAVSLLLVAWAACGVTVPLEYVGDITPLTTSCAVHMIKVSSDGEETGALLGILTLAGEPHAVRIDLGSGGATLGVDLDGDGATSLVPWDQVDADGMLLASPEFVLTDPASQTTSYRVFLMWSPYVPIVVTYCRDNYRAGSLDTPTRGVAVAVVDDDSNGRFGDEGETLFVDVDGDGRLLADFDSHERYGVKEPFVIDGAAYAVASMAPDGSWVEIEPSSAGVQPKPSLLVGCPAPTFAALDARGAPLDIGALRGHIVLLDFWAAWCGPCLEELSTIIGLHEAFGEQGVVVVGVDLDRSETAFRSALAANGLEYLQVYDGPEGPIAALYRIGGIPMTYLIDREGVIRARGLRGDRLVAAVEALLAEEPGS